MRDAAFMYNYNIDVHGVYVSLLVKIRNYFNPLREGETLLRFPPTECDSLGIIIRDFEKAGGVLGHVTSRVRWRQVQ